MSKKVKKITAGIFKRAEDVLLPDIPKSVLKKIGKANKSVLLKKNIIEKNRSSHKELKPGDNRLILLEALYEPTLLINDKPKSKPDYWVFVKQNGKNKIAVAEMSVSKPNYEIVGWRFTDAAGLMNIKKRAEREGGQVLITNSRKGKGAADLSALPFSSNKSIRQKSPKGQVIKIIFEDE